MKFLFDEQLPQAIVVALADSDREVTHVLTEKLGGRSDQEVIEYAGSRGWCFVTADNGILRKPQERAAIARFRVRAFFFTGKTIRDRFAWLQLIVNRLDDMARFAVDNEPPFSAQVPDRGAIGLIKAKTKPVKPPKKV